MHPLQTAIFVAGLAHFTLLSAGIAAVRDFDWRHTLTKLQPMSRQLIWVHAGYMVGVIFALGGVSVAFAADLAAKTPLARALCAFIALFWTVRLLLGFFVFDARPHLTSTLRRVGYAALHCLFAAFATVYAISAA